MWFLSVALAHPQNQHQTAGEDTLSEATETELRWDVFFFQIMRRFRRQYFLVFFFLYFRLGDHHLLKTLHLPRLHTEITQTIPFDPGILFKDLPSCRTFWMKVILMWKWGILIPNSFWEFHFWAPIENNNQTTNWFRSWQFFVPLLGWFNGTLQKGHWPPTKGSKGHGLNQLDGKCS